MSPNQQAQQVFITKQPVELYKVLKFEGIAHSGAQAKLFIDDGRVTVNGEVETRRRRKIVDGDTVRLSGVRLDIVFQPGIVS
jgi:ribosome-associated protein